MLQQFFSTKKGTADLNLRDLLIISCGLSCMLVVGRAVLTGLLTYAFLIWNLFLAIIPYAITEWMGRNNRGRQNKTRFVLIGIGWLLFIPNSFYILTDLFHLAGNDSAPKWFDLVLLFSFAWNGLLLGMLSVAAMERLIAGAWGFRVSQVVLFIVLWLTSFGVYIGRYLRFNSWDIIVQPFSLFSEMWAIIVDPLSNKMEWGLITLYAVFMLVLYTTLKKIGESFRIKQYSS